MLAGVGRAATALALSVESAVPVTAAQLLPPVMALAASSLGNQLNLINLGSSTLKASVPLYFLF